MKTKVVSMLQLLEEYRRPKDELMQSYITQRLDKSYELYEKEITYSMFYLKCKHEKSIIKRLTKLNDKIT